MLELNFSNADLIGSHADQSGLYRNFRVDNYLITAIGDGSEDDEVLAETLTRRPECDPVDGIATIDGETATVSEWMFSERFGASSGSEIYWIDGLAYAPDYAEDVYLMSAPEKNAEVAR